MPRATKTSGRKTAVAVSASLLTAIDAWARRWGCTRDQAAEKLIEQAVTALDVARAKHKRPR